MNLPGGYTFSVFDSPNTLSHRVVVVLDRKRKLIGSDDPYPEGIPHQSLRRKELERKTALTIIGAKE